MNQQSTNNIITLEGNIGSGKTTLLTYLREKYVNNSDVIFLQEPVDEWEQFTDSDGKTMLQKFYADQEKYSFSFQMMAYISRLALLRKTMELNPTATIITERSLYTDKYVFAKMLYDMKKMEDINYKIYCKWFDTFALECPIHKCIYVDTEPEICYERIAKRSRLGENNIPLDYLKQCNNYHKDMVYITLPFQNIKDILVLNGNEDIYLNKNELDKWYKKFDDFIK